MRMLSPEHKRQRAVFLKSNSRRRNRQNDSIYRLLSSSHRRPLDATSVSSSAGGQWSRTQWKKKQQTCRFHLEECLINESFQTSFLIPPRLNPKSSWHDSPAVLHTASTVLTSIHIAVFGKLNCVREQWIDWSARISEGTGQFWVLEPCMHSINPAYWVIISNLPGIWNAKIGNIWYGRTEK